jgi:hypothetical protein
LKRTTPMTRHHPEKRSSDVVARSFSHFHIFTFSHFHVPRPASFPRVQRPTAAVMTGRAGRLIVGLGGRDFMRGHGSHQRADYCGQDEQGRGNRSHGGWQR